MIKKGLELDVRIARSIFPNIGIVDYEGEEIRIKGAIEGSRLRIRVNRKRRDYFEAKILEILEYSPLETQEGCRHFGACGGCTYQKFTYEDELKYKESQVRNLFQAYDLDHKIRGILASPTSQAYRNKMEYTFGDEYKGGPLTLGMHRKGRFYEIETVDGCRICHDDFNKILRYSLDYFQDLGLAFYNKRTHLGFLRNLVVRRSLGQKEILINLVTSSQDQLDMEAYLEGLLRLDLEAEITGLLHTHNDGLGDVIKVDRMDLIYGRDYIVEEICGLKFKISPLSFFQTNTLAAEKLYRTSQDQMGDLRNKEVFDLYSGTGTIAQIMAQLAQNVTAIELVEEAVDMARENAQINGLDNIEFIAGDMFQLVDKLDKKPDLIVIDPPRPGLERSINKIIDFQPEKFLYISCNPKTLAQDIKVFQERGYEPGDIQLLDQFPRTPHVEALTLLVRK